MSENNSESDMLKCFDLSDQSNKHKDIQFAGTSKCLAVLVKQ